MRPERRNLRSGRARAGVRSLEGAVAEHRPYQLGERLVARFSPRLSATCTLTSVATWLQFRCDWAVVQLVLATVGSLTIKISRGEVAEHVQSTRYSERRSQAVAHKRGWSYDGLAWSWVIEALSSKVGHGSLFQNPTQPKISGPNPQKSSPGRPNHHRHLVWHIIPKTLYNNCYTSQTRQTDTLHANCQWKLLFS